MDFSRTVWLDILMSAVFSIKMPFKAIRLVEIIWSKTEEKK